MKLSYTKGKASLLCLALVAASAIISCTPDETGSGNGLTADSVDASFTVTPVEGSPNSFTVKSSGSGVISNRWDSGTGSVAGSDSEVLFLPDADTYTITHTASGRGGTTATATQTIVVPTSDPVAGNLARGGKLNSAEDVAEWTVLNISSSNCAVVFDNNMATFTASGYNQKAIYQAIQVEANKKYKINMTLSTQGVNTTWTEVYCSTTAPVQGSDYSAGGKRLSLNTWTGCGLSAYTGPFTGISCDAPAGSNIVTFPESGTVYLVIKSGGDQNTGVSIDNIEFRGTN